jgi:myo-inositol-1(or 4)-monophosphatase
MTNQAILTVEQKYDFLRIATRAAKIAGKYLIELKSGVIDVAEESSKDVKLVADQNSEEIILDELVKHSDFAILAEEGGKRTAAATNAEYLWIVDPLDGSVNYLENIPLCCISIGLWNDNHPVLGVIYDFNRDDLYTGIVDEGAWLNGKPIRIKEMRTIDSSILCTGFPSSTDFSSGNIAYVINRIKLFRKIRMIGSASLSLAYVAAGKVDAYYENNIKLWDVAAGLAIVKAAGGVIEYTGYPDVLLNVFAGTSKRLHITSSPVD